MSMWCRAKKHILFISDVWIKLICNPVLIQKHVLQPNAKELIKQTYHYVHIIIMIVGGLGGIVSVQCGNVTTTRATTSYTSTSKSTSPTTLSTLESSKPSLEVISSKNTNVSLQKQSFNCIYRPCYFVFMSHTSVLNKRVISYKLILILTWSTFFENNFSYKTKK